MSDQTETTTPLPAPGDQRCPRCFGDHYEAECQTTHLHTKALAVFPNAETIWAGRPDPDSFLIEWDGTNHLAATNEGENADDGTPLYWLCLYTESTWNDGEEPAASIDVTDPVAFVHMLTELHPDGTDFGAWATHYITEIANAEPIMHPRPQRDPLRDLVTATLAHYAARVNFRHRDPLATHALATSDDPRDLVALADAILAYRPATTLDGDLDHAGRIAYRTQIYTRAHEVADMLDPNIDPADRR